MKQAFTVRGRSHADIRQNACEAILMREGEFQVTLAPISESRKLTQNALAFVWYSELASLVHDTPLDQRAYCKLSYGVPILCRDDADFRRVYHLGIGPLDYEDRLKAMEYLPVTRLFSIAQFAEYLDTIDKTSARNGLHLSHPEDKYYLALEGKHR